MKNGEKLKIVKRLEIVKDLLSAQPFGAGNQSALTYINKTINELKGIKEDNRHKGGIR